jgi:hypothetical protein
MPLSARANPLRLNGLQLRTLAILQELARAPETGTPHPDGDAVTIALFPHAHGNHFHVGDAVVMAKDATGLRNEKVWNALARKGLAVSDHPHSITLTRAGLDYPTGIAQDILHRSDH